MKPKTFLIGYTHLDFGCLLEYLKYTGQEDFSADMQKAMNQGLSPGEILCSFYAKMCYKSLVLGKNKNIKKIRSVQDNIINCYDTGHGSVFEHCWLNFVTTDCSRVFTHELVRHRVGTAFSQTSGRYVTLDDLQIVLPPEMHDNVDAGMIVQRIRNNIVDAARELRDLLIPAGSSFDHKKKMTSAIRRIAPNGQTNEIGWSVNIRSLRHILEMRTSRHAEWEIRHVFNEVASLVKAKFPMILYGAKEQIVGNEGLIEYTNLKV